MTDLIRSALSQGRSEDGKIPYLFLQLLMFAAISTYKGKAQAIIRPYASQGTIILKAESTGLITGELKVQVIK
jgi:hypothetical protein